MLKKIYLTLFSFILVSITLSTSVFAWFQTSKVSLVDGVEIGVKEDDDLTISLDGINYYKTISKEMLEKNIGKNPIFKPITTQDGKNFEFGPKKIIDEVIPNKDFIQFDIYFKVITNNDILEQHHDHVYLSNKLDIDYYDEDNKKGTIITSKGKNFITPIEYQEENLLLLPGMSKTYYASDALRIGIINNRDDQGFIYDVSENKNRGFGSQFGAKDYYERKLGVKLNSPSEPSNTIYKLTEFSKIQNDIAIDNNSLATKLELKNVLNGYYEYTGKVTVSIWIEGWDADAFDAIYEDKIKIQLSFKAARYLK